MPLSRGGSSDLGARLGGRMRAQQGGQIGATLGAAIGGITLGYIRYGNRWTTPRQPILFGSAGALRLGAVIGLPLGALIGVGVQRGLHALHVDNRVGDAEARQKTVRRSGRLALIFLGVVVVFALPAFAGVFFAQVVVLVAVRPDGPWPEHHPRPGRPARPLGFVLVSPSAPIRWTAHIDEAEYGIAQWSWWAAVPFAILLAMAFGAFLGLPILGIRGEHLAIATLGFGEIIRLLVASDLLLPILGGPRGIVNIPSR